MSINESGDPYEAYGQRDAMWTSSSEGSRPVWGMALINGRKHFYGYHDVGDVFRVFDADIIAMVNNTTSAFVAPNGQQFVIDGKTIYDPTVPLESITSDEVIDEALEEPELIVDEEPEDVEGPETEEKTTIKRGRRKKS